MFGTPTSFVPFDVVLSVLLLLFEVLLEPFVELLALPVWSVPYKPLFDELLDEPVWALAKPAKNMKMAIIARAANAAEIFFLDFIFFQLYLS